MRAEYLRQWEASCAKLGPRPWLLGECGKPKVIVSDNGTELTSNAILRWAYDHKIAWHYIDPGKPVRMRSPSDLSGGCAMSCSTKLCSARYRTHVLFLRSGMPITTPNDLTRGWAG